MSVLPGWFGPRQPCLLIGWNGASAALAAIGLTVMLPAGQRRDGSPITRHPVSPIILSPDYSEMVRPSGQRDSDHEWRTLSGGRTLPRPVSHLVTALYWFHPLHGHRAAIRAERERRAMTMCLQRNQASE